MSKQQWTILFIDDDEDDYCLVKTYLSDIDRLEVELHWASTYKAGWELLPKADWDVVLIDYDLGLPNGIEFIQEAIANGYNVPFIMLTGRGSHEKDVEAMGAGAFDYITKKEVNSTLMERVIRYAIARKQVEAELEERVRERSVQLQVALEELRVYSEELEQQNEELAQPETGDHLAFSRYKFFFEFSPEGYMITDRSGKILEINRRATQLLNVEQRFLVGKPLASYIGRDQLPAFYQVLNEYHEPGQAKTLHTILQPREERQLDTFLTVIPFDVSGQKTDELFWMVHQG